MNAAVAIEPDSWNFVEGWLKASRTRLTGYAYISFWRAFRTFLAENDVYRPSGLTADLCRAYIPWRRAEVTESTFAVDILCIRSVLKEALRRGLVSTDTLEALYVEKVERPKLPANSQWAWVEPWLNSRYVPDSGTHYRYRTSWRLLSHFFLEVGIQSIEQLTRDDCFRYLTWRNGAKHNTVRRELLFLSVVCNEGIARGLITKNPAEKLKIARGTTREKPEITPEMENEIWQAIGNCQSKYKHFYRMSFLIGMRHGVRVAETRVRLADVQLDTQPPLISFIMKGSRGTKNTVPLHPDLWQPLRELKQNGAEWTFDQPVSPKKMSIAWGTFFEHKGFKKKYPGLSFHSSRVSCISRLARKNVSQAKAMRFVNHSSAAVHQIYLRVQVSDLNDCLI